MTTENEALRAANSVAEDVERTSAILNANVLDAEPPV